MPRIVLVGFTRPAKPRYKDFISGEVVYLASDEVPKDQESMGVLSTAERVYMESMLSDRVRAQLQRLYGGYKVVSVRGCTELMKKIQGDFPNPVREEFPERLVQEVAMHLAPAPAFRTTGRADAQLGNRSIPPGTCHIRFFIQ